MNQRSTPQAQPRFEQPYCSNLNIKKYDLDNLYPNNLIKKIDDSPTASSCLERYIDFIEGNGIHSPLFSELVINRDGQTLDDIHTLVSADKARFSGFSLLVKYNVYCRPCAIYHIPFEQCRLEESDTNGKIAHIVIHPDWSGKITQEGREVRIEEKQLKRVDVYNPNEEVVAQQIANAGGITSYLGQVYYYSDAGYLVYPKPKYDSGITDISTDTGLSNVMNRNVRSNFYAAGMVTYYSNLNEEEEDAIAEQIEAVQGDSNACNIVAVSIQHPDEKPEFTPFSGHNYDKDFTATTAATAERIYSKFGQEGWYCLRIGKIGFSGDLVNDIENEYSRRVKKDQRKLTKVYYSILSHFDRESLPEEPTMEALTIEPYSSINTQIATL